ncbi:uncharacterized protein LOC134452536 isoform X2 [Engraulis encrasicolus]|uniref:uncharacterized protein LOC134452536 isoform X2 n=1 Tax=Engraulis encrasicolus TaxID=184585 RepID=UPI002FD1C3B1
MTCLLTSKVWFWKRSVSVRNLRCNLTRLILVDMRNSWPMFQTVCTGAHVAQPRFCSQDFNWLQLIPEVSTNLSGVSDMTLFGYSIYWSAMTLSAVGFGDIFAVRSEETYYAVITMILGLFAFSGVIMTGMSSTISNLDSERGKFYSRMDAIRIHMTHMGLPQEVQTWTYKYYYYLWLYRKGNAAVGLWARDLPYTLHSAVSTETHIPMFKKATIFDDLNDGLMRAVSAKVSTSTYSPGQILVQMGQVNQNAFYVENGLVEVFGENEDKIASLLPGSLIGEVNLVFKMPRNATIAAATLSEISVLEHKDLVSLLADYPGAGLQVAEAARSRLQNVKYPLWEAFHLALAKNPRNVAIHQNTSVDMKPKDQRILNLFMEFMYHQLKSRPISLHSSDDSKVLGVPTFRPDTRFVKTWEMVIIWCMTVSVFLEIWVITFAYNLDTAGFYYKGWELFFLVVCVLIDVVAIIDIFITLRIEIMTKDGYLSDFKSIFNAYWRSRNLHFDILAIFPSDFFAFLYTGEYLWRHLPIFRVNRLIWIRKIYLHFKRREKDLENNLFVQRTAKCIFFLILSLHVCAGCLYVTGCRERRCDFSTWASDAGLTRPQKNFYHYMLSMYWTVCTMTKIGYGDILPSTMADKMVVTAVALFGLFVFNYIISEIYATTANKNMSRVLYQNFLTSANLFMRRHNISLSLRKRVTDYLSLLWSRYQGEAYPGGPFLLHDLPKELQNIVLVKERGRFLSKVPFFEQAGSEFIQDIASVAVMYYFPRGEIIQYSETLTRELFCIVRGTCQILTDNLSNIVALYGEGMYFGEVGFLFGKPALMTVRAKTHCEILSIHFDHMMEVIEKYPNMKRQMEYLQTKSDYHKDVTDTVEVMMISKQTAQEGEDFSKNKKDTVFAYEGRRYAKKSKCYIEDFGNFPIYAGAEEETVEERLLKLSKTRMVPKEPGNYLEHLEQFFCTTCPSTLLMRNAILPSNPTYIRWEIFRVLMAIAISILTALLISFLHQSGSIWIVLYILGLFCWVDIYIRMHVAFYKENQLQVDTLETAKHYLKNGFLLDFISCFPWEIVALSFVNINLGNLSSSLEAVHLLAYFRAPHILQLYRVPLAFSFYQSGIATEKTAVTFFQLFLYTALCLHFFTCFVFAIVCPLGDMNGDPSIYTLPGTKHNCSASTWVLHLDSTFIVELETLSFTELYGISLYFAITTLCGVGYGDIHPTSAAVRIAMIFTILAGTVYSGLLSGTVASILTNADVIRAAFTDRKDSLGLFLKSQKITGPIYESIMKFYAFKWIKTKGINHDLLFEYLPSSLLGDLSTVFYAGVIAKAFGIKIKRKQRQDMLTENLKTLTPLERKLSGKMAKPFFQETLRKESLEQLETDPGFIRLLAGKIRTRLFRAGDIIFRRTEYGSEMYFIDKGEVHVLSMDEETVVITLKEGEYFGEGSLLFAEQRTTTIRAASNCHLFILEKESLDEAIRYYPTILRDIKQAAERKRAEQQQRLNTGIYGSIENTDSSIVETNELPRDTGYFKLYNDLMAEEHIKKHHRSTFTNNMDFIVTFVQRFIKHHNFTADPDSLLRVIVQYTSCVCIVIVFSIVVAMHSTHTLSIPAYNLAIVIEYLLLIEIMFKFHLSYYDDNGNYISNYKSVSQNYLFRKVGFFFDMLSCFPFALTVLNMAYGRSSHDFVAIFTTVRLGHTMRILNVFYVIRNEERNISTNLLLIRIIKFLVQCLLLSFIISSLFVQSAHQGSPGEETFLGDYKTREPEANWFMFGLYWTVGTYTATGYGDFHPKRLFEMIFAMIVMVISKTHIIYHMGAFTSSQANKQSLQIAFEAKLQGVEDYMVDLKLTTAMEQRVTHFYNYIWTRTKGIKTEDLFDDIPFSLKTDILARVCVPLLKRQQLFAHLSDTFLRHLSTKMKLTSYTAGEMVKKRGDVGDRMWLILYGRVKVFGPGEKPMVHIVTTGQILGLHLLFGRHLCGLTATSLNYVDVLHLTRIDFDIVCSYYPHVKKRLYKRITNFASVPL